jgi:YD repeat-containing protein
MTSIRRVGHGLSCWRPRSFSYDGLSRLTGETNPESGTINYHYDENRRVAAVSPRSWISFCSGCPMFVPHGRTWGSPVLFLTYPLAPRTRSSDI